MVLLLLAVALRLVELFVVARDRLFVSGQRLVGLVWNAVGEHLQIEDADQAVALPDPVVESGLPGSTVSIQSATLQSSTAIGLRSTP